MVPDQAERIGQLSRSPVLRAWLAARVVVLVALLLVVVVHPQVRASLGSWDATWYRDIAAHGYGGAPDGAARFFPVWPLLGRLASLLTGIPPGPVLVVLANFAAVAYLVLARRVARAEGLGDAAARVPAAVALAPAGTVLVMGYTEALFGVLLCLVLLTSRSRRWWWCSLAGLVAGALRPTGVVLALPVVIEACRGLRQAAPAEVAARLAAAAAPAAGLAAYLGWSWAAYGDPLVPYRVQVDPALRGAAFVDPLRTLAEVPTRHGTDLLGLALNGTFVVVALALLVAGARLLPASFTAFSAATLLLGVTARDFSSFERYACSALPLLLVAAVLVDRRPRVARAVVGLAVVVLVVQAALTFAGRYLP